MSGSNVLGLNPSKVFFSSEITRVLLNEFSAEVWWLIGSAPHCFKHLGKRRGTSFYRRNWFQKKIPNYT